MAKIKIHHIDHIIYVFVFILIAIAGFMFFTSTTMINTRASGQSIQTKIDACYAKSCKDDEGATCPAYETIRKSKDKKDKLCQKCYSKCALEVIEPKNGGAPAPTSTSNGGETGSQQDQGGSVGSQQDQGGGVGDLNPGDPTL